MLVTIRVYKPVSEAESRFLVATGLANVTVTDLQAAEEGPLALTIRADIRRGGCFHPTSAHLGKAAHLRANVFWA